MTTTTQILDMTGYFDIPSVFAPAAKEPKFPTIKDLAEFTLLQISNIGEDLNDFTTLVASTGFVDQTTLESAKHSTVPNVSPREIFFWCLLNTTQYRKDLEDAASSKSQTLTRLLSQLAYEAPKSSPDIPGSWVPQFLKGTTREVDPCVPQIFFVCSGIVVPTGTLHPTTYVGASLERLRSWPQFSDIRRKARDSNIGVDDTARWSKFVEDLAEFEALALDPYDPVARLAFPKNFVNGNMPAEFQEQYQHKLAPIRDCRQHLGQAFSERKEGRTVISSCYLCQLTQKFKVTDEG
ncbi:hypothetical protein B0T25DRAFT_360930 [Lasiosphaeria hispida]|uniref:Uncharacterized protein n=1 Tax=Lasiosphaeria hispida TaxID=260671 RepID=A0AAJ0H5C1_9PEZI|nr:hypothetical protein B0T25DRAFT_360930 [Lasiosphaeria hispida]